MDICEDELIWTVWDEQPHCVSCSWVFFCFVLWDFESYVI